MQTKATQTNTASTYVEIVGAHVSHESKEARKFIFGYKPDCWVPKSASKLVDQVLYVDQHFALRKAVEWQGKFPKGTGYTKMEPTTKQENTVADVVPMVQDLLGGVARILKKLEALEKDNEQNKELDKATAKIMSVINKH